MFPDDETDKNGRKMRHSGGTLGSACCVLHQGGITIISPEKITGRERITSPENPCLTFGWTFGLLRVPAVLILGPESNADGFRGFVMCCCSTQLEPPTQNSL